MGVLPKHGTGIMKVMSSNLAASLGFFLLVPQFYFKILCPEVLLWVKNNLS